MTFQSDCDTDLPDWLGTLMLLSPPCWWSQRQTDGFPGNAGRAKTKRSSQPNNNKKCQKQLTSRLDTVVGGRLSCCWYVATSYCPSWNKVCNLWPWVTKQRSAFSIFGATRGVTVSMSAFLACHHCYCAGSSLAWGLNLRAVVCGIFWSSSPGVFSGYSGFLPSFIGLMIQPIK